MQSNKEPHSLGDQIENLIASENNFTKINPEQAMTLLNTREEIENKDLVNLKDKLLKASGYNIVQSNSNDTNRIPVFHDTPSLIDIHDWYYKKENVIFKIKENYKNKTYEGQIIRIEEHCKNKYIYLHIVEKNADSSKVIVVERQNIVSCVLLRKSIFEYNLQAKDGVYLGAKTESFYINKSLLIQKSVYFKNILLAYKEETKLINLNSRFSDEQLRVLLLAIDTEDCSNLTLRQTRLLLDCIPSRGETDDALFPKLIALAKSRIHKFLSDTISDEDIDRNVIFRITIKSKEKPTPEQINDWSENKDDVILKDKYGVTYQGKIRIEEGKYLDSYSSDDASSEDNFSNQKDIHVFIGSQDLLLSNIVSFSYIKKYTSIFEKNVKSDEAIFLCSENKKFCVNKSILITISAYFKKLLSNVSKENKAVDLSQFFSDDELEAFLFFINKKDCSLLTFKQAIHLLRLSDLKKIKISSNAQHLKFIEDKIFENITTSGVELLSDVKKILPPNILINFKDRMLEWCKTSKSNVAKFLIDLDFNDLKKSKSLIVSHFGCTFDFNVIEKSGIQLNSYEICQIMSLLHLCGFKIERLNILDISFNKFRHELETVLFYLIGNKDIKYFATNWSKPEIKNSTLEINTNTMLFNFIKFTSSLDKISMNTVYLSPEILLKINDLQSYKLYKKATILFLLAARLDKSSIPYDVPKDCLDYIFESGMKNW